ncbi:IS110 family transposase [Paraburkholderia dipogonis]|uniref:IS110 family transposase n=1 Tax=Paraburkholderia dipogonis TaxID=1211383 RepID=A0ABW9B374_9BURK
MDYATLVGIDLGKQTFHVHGQDSRGKAVFRKKFGRKQLIEFLATCHSCTVVMEACAGSHFMARKLSSFGHEVKLISPQFVRPFVKSNKNDFIDAEAICEAASRPAMRFVTPKTESQQTLSILHRVRESMVQDRTRTSTRCTASCSRVRRQPARPVFRDCRRFLISILCRPVLLPSSSGYMSTSSISSNRSVRSIAN